MMMPDLMSSPSRESDPDLSDSCVTEFTTKTKTHGVVLNCPTYTKDNVTLANADCLYVLKRMQDKTAALVVIDPPYVTAEVWRQYCTAAKFLLRPSNSRVQAAKPEM